jgi:cytochrome c biogenesis protein CcmG/thiol:disulfide interchange protein DsbE
MKYAVPLTAFLALTVFLIAGLGIDPREIPSPLIGHAAPNFQLVRLDQPQSRFSPQDVSGKVWLLNVWASWCVACREEHRYLLDLARRAVVPIYGLDYKDRRQDALEMLRELGNPYVLSAEDTDGRVGIDYGVYGVPETYLIDRIGVIRYKRIGAITPEVINKEILPLIERLNR